MRQMLMGWALVALVIVGAMGSDNGAQFEENMQFPGQSVQGNQGPNQMEQGTMRRTACLMLSRYHSNSHREEIEPLVKEFESETQQQFINKLYAVAVETCEAAISMEEVQQMYTPNSNFDATLLFHVFEGLDYKTIPEEASKFSRNQKNIVTFIKDFDAKMEMEREEQKAKETMEKGDSRNEFKIFGVATSSIPKEIKYLYLVVVSLVLFGGIYYGMSRLDAKPKDKKKKKKTDKPE